MKRLIFLILPAIGLLIACGSGDEENGQAGYASQQQEAPADAPVPENVLRAAKIAKLAMAEPARFNEFVKAEGMTSEEFEALLYDIAADPVLSKAYSKAKQ